MLRQQKNYTENSPKRHKQKEKPMTDNNIEALRTRLKEHHQHNLGMKEAGTVSIRAISNATGLNYWTLLRFANDQRTMMPKSRAKLAEYFEGVA